MDKHEQLKLELKGKILSGEYPAQSRFPSQNELIKRKKLSHSTVLRVMRELSEEGYIERVRGQGTFVADKENWSKKDVKFTIKVVVNPNWFSGDLKNPSNFNSIEIYGGIVRRASEHGLEVKTIYFGDDSEISETFFGPNDFFFLFCSIGFYARMALELQKRGIPFLVYDTMLPFSNEYNCISVNVLWPSYKMTSKLLEAGYKDVVFIRPSRDLGWVVPKEKGYRIAMKEAGVNPDFLTVDHRLAPEEISRDLDRLLEKRSPDAIFCFNDYCAFLVLKNLLARGIRVPDDIALVGFDDSYQAEAAPVPLTTCEYPREKFGEEAVALMRFIYDNPEITPTIKSLDCGLVFRKSFIPKNEETPDSVFHTLIDCEKLT